MDEAAEVGPIPRLYVHFFSFPFRVPKKGGEKRVKIGRSVAGCGALRVRAAHSLHGFYSEMILTYRSVARFSRFNFHSEVLHDSQDP